MTALPQFISRICHSHPGVFKQISVIIATLMAAYPQQAMWHMIAVSKVGEGSGSLPIDCFLRLIF